MAAPRPVTATPPAPTRAEDTPEPHSGHERADLLLARAQGCGDVAVAARLRQEAILLTLDLPDRVARRYGGRGVEVEDLVQVGRMALVKAAHGYRVDHGHGFAAYALPTILGEVKRHFRDTAWAVRPPRRLQEVGAMVGAAEEELTHALRRRPTETEVATALDVDLTEVRGARQSGAAYHAVCLDPPGPDGRGIDVVATESADIDRLLRLQVLCQQVGNLTERERLIVHLRFVEERTQSEIGSVLGVSQMQVSRLLTGILAALRHDLADLAPAA